MERIEGPEVSSDDHLEEDSICSWMSEPESQVNNWRGWKKQGSSLYSNAPKNTDENGQVWALSELAAKEVAASIPFEMVERYYPPVPEQIQLRIAFWSFPVHEEDIRLYSCLANGCSEEFTKGEILLKSGSVYDPLQIGFHLSATIIPGKGKSSQSTSVTFDRRKIVSCQCSCDSTAEWCSHIVALCLHRIHMATTVCLRAPVSESLSRLQRDQLQKFAQYLIAELPLQILPTAQRILDELLSSTPTAINTVCGAPDPTAGGSTGELSSFCLDSKNLKNNVKKILIKFCIPAPIVFSDVNYLSTTSPPSAAEWCSFLRPLRGREPEGMWNLLSIVKEMFKRNDRNSIPLLEIITTQCLEIVQIMVWWYNTKVTLHHKNQGKNSVNSNSQASQNACASLCDEIVTLWTLAALNPCISPQERALLKQRLILYHTTVIEKVKASQNGSGSSSNSGRNSNSAKSKLADLELFPGFKPAIEGCFLDWSDYPIPGVTYGQNAHYLSPFAIFKQNQPVDNTSSQVNSSQAVLYCDYPTSSRPRNHDDQLTANESDEGVFIQSAGATAAALPSSAPITNEEDSDWSSSAVDSDVRVNSSDDPQDPEDQYKVYFYDSKAPVSLKSEQRDNEDGPGFDILKNLRTSIEDPWEVLFMRAEGIHAHGYHNHACTMAVHLAHHMLQNPIDLLAEIPPKAPISNKKNKRGINAASHQATYLASITLAHCSFLCTVLSENSRHFNLAFQIGMYGLQLARPPASSKPMEVKLAHQESELVNHLKKIPLGPDELADLRKKALALKEGTLRFKGDALLPLSLASFIFESLVPSSEKPLNKYISVADEQLGFEAAVATIGMKANVSEAEHPLLCEGTRKQRGELALQLLFHYQDDPQRLASIMDKLLDKEVHTNFTTSITAQWYCFYGQGNQRSQPRVATVDLSNQVESLSMNESLNPPRAGWEEFFNDEVANDIDRLRIQRGQNPENSRRGITLSDSGSSGNSSADSLDSSSSTGLHIASNPRRSVDLESLAAAAPSQQLTKTQVSTKYPKPLPGSQFSGVPVTSSRSHTAMKPNRFKGKRSCPSVPNQPSEASAHFMFELAKTVLVKAGGTSSTSLFTQHTAGSNPRGPHKSLHMCAFQIGLYALGLHNSVSPNWLSRTYSSHVSWINGQALEIGALAINFLISNWEGHLTPQEAATIADKASRGSDIQLLRAADSLALSVLSHASALNPIEIQKALLQCKGQSQAVLEKACLAVEKAAADGGVNPQVLFLVAHHWQSMWEGLNPPRGTSPPRSSDMPNRIPTFHLHYPMYPVLPGGGVPMFMTPPNPVNIQQFQQQVIAATAGSLQIYPTNPQPGGTIRYQGGIVPVSSLLTPPTSTIAQIPVTVAPTALLAQPPSAPPPLLAQPPSSMNNLAGGPSNFLLSAYRVGMLALEILGRRVSEDRPQDRCARNLNYGDDVKSLLSTSRKLGLSYFQNFLIMIHATIVSPFLLQDLLREASSYLVQPFPNGHLQGALHNTTIAQAIRSNHYLSQIAHKCCQLYCQCINQKLYKLSANDYDDFVSTVLSARTVFSWLADGPSTFQNLLQSIGRSKSCNIDLWQQILTSIQKGNLEPM